jgi:hypothetical protein
MLKEPCPYHKGPTNHNLDDCHMLWRYFESLGIKKDDKKDDPREKDDNKDEGFSEIHDCFMIYGGPLMCLPMRQHKWERREIFSIQLVTPLFLDWSKMAITFDHGDHSDYVPNPRVYPLVVDPIIANTCLTKVLMYGGSSLNIIFAQPSTSWGSRGRSSDPALGASMELCQGDEQNPSGESTYPSASAPLQL